MLNVKIGVNARASMSAPDRLTTFEIGSIYGIAPHSLRFYEEQGLLSPLVENGTRYYTVKDRIRLELILKGQRLGFGFLELKLLIVSAVEANASRDAPADEGESARTSPVRPTLAEDIRQAERKIATMQARITDLRRSIDEGS